jgi:hypothetical protein
MPMTFTLGPSLPCSSYAPRIDSDSGRCQRCGAMPSDHIGGGGGRGTVNMVDPAYAKAEPSSAIKDTMASEARAVANRLADSYAGQGKVARVRVEVEFGDGTGVHFEARRQT